MRGQYTSIDFWELDEESAETLLARLQELGLAPDAYVVPPERALTFHLDDETARALDTALAHTTAGEDVVQMVAGIRYMIAEWESERPED